MEQSFFADMGGVRIKLEDDEFPVTSKHIYVLFKHGLIQLDAITPAAIKQTSWFLLACLARLIQHISITSLELSTIAFVVCTIGTNIMWLSKPKDVFVPIVLNIDNTLEGMLAMIGPQIPDAKSEAANWKWSPLEKFDNMRPNFFVDVGQYLPRPFVPEPGSFKLSQPGQKVRFRNDRLPPYERDYLLNHFLGVLSLLFGAVYIAGWNISFPTMIERILWRVCTLMMLSLVAAFWLVDAGVELYQRKKIKVLGNEGRWR